MKIKLEDPTVKNVIRKFAERSRTGFKKYDVTLRDDDQTFDTWLNHIQEELMDAVNYIEKAREELAEVRLLIPQDLNGRDWVMLSDEEGNDYLIKKL